MKRASDASNNPETVKRRNALPTGNEQVILQQTSILSRENLTNLQIEGLLEEVSSKAIYEDKTISHYCSSFSKLLSSNEEATPSNLQHWLKLLNLKKSSQDSIVFKRPQKVQVIGSYELQTVTLPYINIDLCCTIPNDTFEHR